MQPGPREGRKVGSTRKVGITCTTRQESWCFLWFEVFDTNFPDFADSGDYYYYSAPGCQTWADAADFDVLGPPPAEFVIVVFTLARIWPDLHATRLMYV